MNDALAAIRQKAAERCGLAEYPYALIRAYEASVMPARAWAYVPAERRAEILAAVATERAKLGLK